MIEVKVMELGGSVFGKVSVPDNSTVFDAIKAAGCRTDVDKTVTVNDEDVAIDTLVKHGDVICVEPNIKGN